jgi:hypothetical protein
MDRITMPWFGDQEWERSQGTVIASLGAGAAQRASAMTLALLLQRFAVGWGKQKMGLSTAGED